MAKLTKSLPIIKERNCSASMVLDSRTNRKGATEFPLAIRFTIDRKFFYYAVGGSFTEKKFSDICNATKSASDNYRIQKEWKDTFIPKYKSILENLNKGSLLTFETVRVAITTGNVNTGANAEDPANHSFISVWEDVIHHLWTDNDGKRCTTGDSYNCALNSFLNILGQDAVKGFNIGQNELQKWKDGMKTGVKSRGGDIIGKISDATAGIYLRNCRAVWNECRSRGFLLDVPYPFSNKKEKNLVSIPKAPAKKGVTLTVAQMTDLYNVFINKNYPKSWKKSYTERAHYSLGLFLVQYLCNGFNLADAARLTYNDYYYQNNQQAFCFNRKKTADRSANNSLVIVPIIEPLQKILDEIAAPPTRGGFVFPDILNGAVSERDRYKRTQQENSNIRDRVVKICHEVLHWDDSIKPSGTWCRHSFATNIYFKWRDTGYLSEAMGHDHYENLITHIYIERYPLETLMKYNSYLLSLEPENAEAERESLLARISSLSNEELSSILANFNK